MSDGSDKKPVSAWRLARRILGYGRRYYTVLILMFVVMAALAVVDRGRALVVMPLFNEISDTGTPVTCASCGLEDKVGEEVGFCAGCGEELNLEEAKEAAGASGWSRLYFYAYLVLGASLLIFPLKYGRVYLANWLTLKVLCDLRNEVSRHLLRLPMHYFHNRRAGDLISRVSNDTAVMQQSVRFLMEDTIMQPLYLSAAIGLVMVANWKLGLAAVVLFPLYTLPIIRIGRAMRRTRKKSLERLGDLTESMNQMYGGIRIVKAFHQEEQEMATFEARNRSFFSKMMSAMKKKALADSIVEVFISLIIAALILLGGLAFIQEDMNAGSLVLFVLGIAMMNTPSKELAKGYNRLQESLAASERIFEILDSDPEPPDPPDAVDAPEIRTGMEYQNLTFAYDTEPVLRDINLKVSPGEVVALVGRSGAGKSTMVDLLCRYYDPQGGRILLEGHDLRNIKRGSLRESLAVVAQETFLFNTSIGENIRYGKPDAPQEEVEAAARAAHIHDFIASLPNGYDTVTGERGAKISGGQRQRLAIARAILKNPAILILDEATSALDSEAEQQVQSALWNLIRDGGNRRITFIIAHRLSTVRRVDRIVVLDDSRIVEQGKHEDLLEKGGIYAQLHRLQFEDV